MLKERISSDELWKRVQEDREREYQELRPDLTLFRALPEETRVQLEEDAAEAEEIERFGKFDGEIPKIYRLSSSLARSGRESVRFERWRESRAIVK